MKGIDRHHLVALFALASANCSASCSADATPSAREAAIARAPHAPEVIADGIPDLGGHAYHVGALTAIGAVAGTITLEGAAPSDTVPTTSDPDVCGSTVPPVVERNAKGVSNTLVWIAGVDAGKALPIEKRVTVVSEDCTLDPRVAATVVGATVNVLNIDRLVHRLVFTRSHSPDTLAVMSFFNEGQVVPSEKLTTTTGVVQIRCLQHPWTRGFVAVFDHPYFAVTETNGKFKIDSLPAGSYTLMVWHDGLAMPLERRVTVVAGATAAMDVPVTLVRDSVAHADDAASDDADDHSGA